MRPSATGVFLFLGACAQIVEPEAAPTRAPAGDVVEFELERVP
jgi:hypothetical protein